MYLKLILAACLLAFFAVVFSAHTRLSDAGLGCTNWPACYEENALKQRQPPHPDTAQKHDSRQWKLQNLAGLLLGMLSIVICGHSWQKRRELQQSPLLPTLLVVLMVFLGAFGILAFSYLPRAVIVPVHLAGGIATLMLLTWIALRQIPPLGEVSDIEANHWHRFAKLGLLLVLTQTILGGWVSSNFAALACTEFPLCKGSVLPPIDFTYSLNSYLPLSAEQLTAIHFMHRVGAFLTLAYVIWLSSGVMAVARLRFIGKVMLGLVLLQFAIGVSNVLLGLPLNGVVLHNAAAMLLLVTLLALNYRLQEQRA